MNDETHDRDLIAEVAATIASTLAIGGTLETITRRIGEAFDVASCDIHDYSAETGLLTFVANWQLEPEDDQIEGFYGASFTPEEWPSFVPVVRDRVLCETHVDDPELDEVDRRQMMQWGQTAGLDAPLVYDDEVIGVLGLTEDRWPRSFTRGERMLFAQLADLAAIAIHNARTYSELKKRGQEEEEQNRRLTALLAASRHLISGRDDADVLHAMASEAREALGCRWCAIYTKDNDTGDLVRRTASGRTPSAERREGRAAHGQRPDDRATMQALDSNKLAVEPSDAGVTRLCVPLLFAGRPQGIMVLESAQVGREFSQHDLGLARGLGEHVSAAIHNGRLLLALKEQATTDGLTGLYNRRHFDERLAEEVARAVRYSLPLSLLLLDLDNFKHVNDALGHPAGDRVLRAVASIMRTQLRNLIDIPARYGGDEFAVILPGAPLACGTTTRSPSDGAIVAPLPDGPDRRGTTGWGAPASSDGSAPSMWALAVGERLRRRIETETSTLADATATGTITVSVGAAEYPLHGDTPELLVAAVDRALYGAKQQGRNAVAAPSPPPNS